MKHWRDMEEAGLIHCQGAIAAGEYTLCGRALEGPDGDREMKLTCDPIDCPSCEAIIAHCKIIKPAEINRSGRRRLEIHRAANR